MAEERLNSIQYLSLLFILLPHESPLHAIKVWFEVADLFGDISYSLLELQVARS